MFPKRKIYPPPRVSCIPRCFPSPPPPWPPPSWNVRSRSRERRLIPGRCHLEPPRQLQGRFLHITDLHPDPLYRPGAALSTACHRNRPKKEPSRAGYLGTPYESVISPSVCYRFRKPRSGTSDLQYGERILTLILVFPRHRDCDSPLSLTNYTLDYLEQNWVNDIDFVICAAPLPHHLSPYTMVSDESFCSSHAVAHRLTLLNLVGEIRDR